MFYSISTLVVYLMLSPSYTHIYIYMLEGFCIKLYIPSEDQVLQKGCWNKYIMETHLSVIQNYIYIYIYILSSTDRLVSFYQNSSVWRDRLDSRSWDRNLADSNVNPRFRHEETSASKGNLNAYESHLFFVYIYPLNGYRELNSFEEPCITLVATITSHTWELNPTGVWEHIYCHPQTDLFRSIRTLECG